MTYLTRKHHPSYRTIQQVSQDGDTRPARRAAARASYLPACVRIAHAIRLVIALALGALLCANVSATEFCADLNARYAGGIIRCIDFVKATDAAINPSPNAGLYGGPTGIDTHLFDPSVSATAGTSGSLHWKIRSYDQVRAEEPSLSKGAAWAKAMDSHGGAWQRWIGLDKLTPGTTYYYQFKLRFNAAYKTWWGGGGMKVFGLDAGCRTVNGVQIPTVCEQYTGNHVTDMGTATSMEFGTMTTVNWFPSSVPNAANRPYPTVYQGSSNFALTQGFAPLVSSPWGTAQQEQPGPDAGNCNGLARLNNPDFTECVGYGAPNVWHEVTIALKPGPTYYDTNPAVTGKVLHHDTLFKVWYDGQLIIDFDPALGDAACAANQQGNDGSRLTDPHPSWDVCRTGADILRDSRDKPPNSSYCIFSCGAGDPGADLTQFILWTFSYRRGYPPGDGKWCDSEIGAADPAYGLCKALAQSGPAPTDNPSMFDAFLHHQQVDVYMDDWVASTVPLPMKRRAAGARVGAGSFGLDARDLDMVPPNTWTRLFPGPDKTFYNTALGTLPAGDPYNASGQDLSASNTTGASTMSATNYTKEVPVQIGVPLGGGFIGTPWGNGKMLYFGGGHSGYRANRVNVFDLNLGRWSQSSYTPDMGAQIPGGIGPRVPTPPGTGCTPEPFTKPTDVGGPTTYFKVTGTMTAGSPVITGLSSTNNMCPIVGTCPGQGAITGGYAITGQGVPKGAVIKSVDSATQVTMTVAATSSGTVALEGGRPYCTAGGAPNGSAGGRGWWEHMDDRYAWDDRAKAWMLVQNSGTWLYDDVTEQWKLVAGPWPDSDSLMCGSGDYTAMGIRFSSALNQMLNWCSTDAIFGFDYGGGPPNYTGAKWVKLHQVAQADRNPNTDVLSQIAWDPVRKRLYRLTQRSTPFYGGTGEWNPMIQWYDPIANRSGKLDSSKPNFPQGYSSPRDVNTFAPDTSKCWTVVCQQVTASLTVDKDGNLYVVGRRAGDAQIILWRLTDPLGPNETWTVLDKFNFNTYDALGLPLWTDAQAPADTSHEFVLSGSTMSLLTYVPERDMFLLITRDGSGEGGASTRGTGSANAGGCYLNGVADDCFRMYGFRFDASITTIGGAGNSDVSVADAGPTTPPTDSTSSSPGSGASTPASIPDGASAPASTPVSTATSGVVSTSSSPATTSSPPTITGFSATPNAIAAGQSVSLSATVSNATSITLDGTPITALPVVATPSSTHTYTLTAAGSGGATTAKATVIVAGQPDPAAPPSAPNYEGSWWASPAGSESGWGLNLAHQGDVVFLTWFTYDAHGQPWWLSMTGNKVDDRTYSGVLYETHGPAFDATPFAPSAVTYRPVGTGTVNFADTDNGTFSYTIAAGSLTKAMLASGSMISQVKTITRLAFGPATSCAFAALDDLRLATNYQDVWWTAPAGSESGWGINLTHQGDAIFATWFTYNSDGSPLWLSASLSLSAPGTYDGAIIRSTGPAFNSNPFRPGDVARTSVGSLRLVFADGNDATFSYTYGGVTQSKAITRMVFRTPGTSCR